MKIRGKFQQKRQKHLKNMREIAENVVQTRLKYVRTYYIGHFGTECELWVKFLSFH